MINRLNNKPFTKLLCTIIASMQLLSVNSFTLAAPASAVATPSKENTDTKATNDKSIKVVASGKTLEFDVPPQIINGRVLVPLRKIFETLEAQVTWFDETKTVLAKNKAGTTVEVIINSYTAKINDREILLDVPPQIISERTLVPARFISESLGYIVSWDEKTQTVNINKGPSPTASADKSLQTAASTAKAVYDSNQTYKPITSEDRLAVQKCITVFFESLQKGDINAASECLVPENSTKFLAAATGEAPAMQQIEIAAQNKYTITSFSTRAFISDEKTHANYDIAKDTPTVFFDIAFAYTNNEGNSVGSAFVIEGVKIQGNWRMKITAVG